MTVMFSQRRLGMCGYLLAEFEPQRICCGEPTQYSTGTYCAHHYQLCHIPNSALKKTPFLFRSSW
jgi:hypothetical protein